MIEELEQLEKEMRQLIAKITEMNKLSKRLEGEEKDNILRRSVQNNIKLYSISQRLGQFVK